MSENNLPAIPSSLNPRQAMFAREYVCNGRNATQAAIIAGYSPGTAYSQGHRLLKNVGIQKYLREVYRVWSLDVENILNELAGVGYARLEEFATWDEEGRVHLKQPGEILDESMAALKKIKQRRRIETHGKGEDKYTVETIDLEIELHDKISALRELRKHAGGGADQPGEQLKAGAGVTVVVIQSKPFGFERQEPSEQANAAEAIE